MKNYTSKGSEKQMATIQKHETSSRVEILGWLGFDMKVKAQPPEVARILPEDHLYIRSTEARLPQSQSRGGVA